MVPPWSVQVMRSCLLWSQVQVSTLLDAARSCLCEILEHMTIPIPPTSLLGRVRFTPSHKQWARAHAIAMVAMQGALNSEY
jgi:hypothetical protein